MKRKRQVKNATGYLYDHWKIENKQCIWVMCKNMANTYCVCKRMLICDECISSHFYYKYKCEHCSRLICTYCECCYKGYDSICYECDNMLIKKRKQLKLYG
jgi:hypothetical protein